MFPKFMQVGLYTGTCIRGWREGGGGVIFGMLIRFHIRGAYSGELIYGERINGILPYFLNNL